jgi:mRNA-degrading endonuclease YafQ of YafQ-DinJ toxin-antitoxin module
MYFYKPHGRVEKSLVSLDHQDLEEYFATVFDLKKDPIHGGSKNHALRGPLKGYRSVRFGAPKKDWRLLFRVEEDKLKIIAVLMGKHGQGSRDVYAWAMKAKKKGTLE